jgi:predicted sulfurtransferase
LRNVKVMGERHCGGCQQGLVSGQLVYVACSSMRRGQIEGKTWHGMGAVYCEKCGRKVQKDLEMCRYIGNHCRNCGRPLVKGTTAWAAFGSKKYCQECYVTLVHEVEDSPNEDKELETFFAEVKEEK